MKTGITFSTYFNAFRNADEDLEDSKGHPAAKGDEQQQTEDCVDLQGGTLLLAWTLGDGFGEDIFGEDFADDFSAQELFSDSVVAIDIEAAFSNLSRPAGR